MCLVCVLSVCLLCVLIVCAWCVLGVCLVCVCLVCARCVYRAVRAEQRPGLQGRQEGEPSPDGGPPGDCYCFIRVREHSLFRRDGRNLICQIPIHYAQAALGAAIEVPTLDGPEELKIPSGTQSGAVFKLRGRGMPDPRYGKRGDLLVQVHIEVAQKLTDEHREILRRLAEYEKRDVTPERTSFFAKLKDYFRNS